MCSILVVDDEPSVREVMARWAERLGHEVRQAADADEALERMAERLRDEYPGTAVVMATASQGADVALSSLRLGAVDFLPKPFSSEQFRHSLARGVRWHRDAEHSRQRLESLQREVHEHLAHIESFFAATPVVSDADLDRLIDGIMPD